MVKVPLRDLQTKIGPVRSIALPLDHDGCVVPDGHEKPRTDVLVQLCVIVVVMSGLRFEIGLSSVLRLGVGELEVSQRNTFVESAEIFYQGPDFAPSSISSYNEIKAGRCRAVRKLKEGPSVPVQDSLA